MRNTFKVLFYVNSSKEKNGVAPILGRITVNGQAAQFSCKQSVVLSLWDAKANRAKANYLKYCIVRNHLANFIGSYYKRKDIAMKELSEDCIRQFDVYMCKELYLSPSGVRMYTTPLKMIVTRAHCDGHLHRNPFSQYHASMSVRER